MAKHTNLLWGSSGHGKSNLLKTFAKGLWRETGKRTRLVSAEKAQGEGLFREGIQEGWLLPWWIDAKMDKDGGVVAPFEMMTQAMLGQWPEDLDNPFSRLIPAFSIQYRGVCQGKHVAPGQTESTPQLVYQSDKPAAAASQLICPKCKQPVIQETVRTVTDGRLKDVGAYFLEGLTEFGDLMMKNMSVRAARGEQLGGGDKGGVAVRFRDGDMDIAGSSMASYGIAQRQCKNRVDESKHLPVDYVWWTAGREDGKDWDRDIVVAGPKLPGSAATADVPRWFGTTLSACAAPNGSGEMEYRLYLRPYCMDWLPLMAKKENVVDNRIPPERLKGIPQFVKVDYEAEFLSVAGQKMKPDQLLWDITRLIEQRQAGEGKK